MTCNNGQKSDLNLWHCKYPPYAFNQWATRIHPSRAHLHRYLYIKTHVNMIWDIRLLLNFSIFHWTVSVGNWTINLQGRSLIIYPRGHCRTTQDSATKYVHMYGLCMFVQTRELIKKKKIIINQIKQNKQKLKLLHISDLLIACWNREKLWGIWLYCCLL